MKKCSTCKEEKDESIFGKDKRMRDGFRSQCKVCHKKSTDIWRKNNPEKVKSNRKKHYVNNREEMLEKSRVQHKNLSKEQREEKREYLKKYYRKNRETYREKGKTKWRLRTEEERQSDYLRQREYYEKNKEEITSRSRERYNNLSQDQKNKNTERTKDWRQCNRNKTKAWSAVGNAILLGKIEKPIYCELCGAFDVKIHAHHSDYSKPLEVLWLCHGCHMTLHSDERLNNINKS